MIRGLDGVDGAITAGESRIGIRPRRAGPRPGRVSNGHGWFVEGVDVWHPVGVHDGVLGVGFARPVRGPGRDQPLVVEERSTKSALEEVVGNRVFRMVVLVEVLVDGKRLRVVVALRQADGIATGGVAILLAAVQLVLLLVEAVHDVASAAAWQVGRAVGIAIGREGRTGPRARVRASRDVGVDLKWGVGEVAGERVIGLGGRGGRRTRGVVAARRQLVREVDVVLQQAREGGTVLLDLQRMRGVGTRQAVDAFPAAIQVVEAMVLLVDDDDVVDAAEW